MQALACVLGKIMPILMKINEDLIVGATGLSLNDITICSNINITTNGWNIKFPNGIMIQAKYMSGTPSNATQDGTFYLALLNMGNWDVPFKSIIHHWKSLSGCSGARAYWLMSNNDSVTTTSAGQAKIGLNWNGFSNAVKLYSFAIGTWK